MKTERNRAKTIVLAILFVVLIALFYQNYACLPIPRQTPKMSTHGYEVWVSTSFKSFMPGTERFCIPKDWQALGEERLERGGASFPEGSTGIIIKSSDFITVPVPLEKTDFELSVVYLKAMPEDERVAYIEIIARAFNDVGSLYPTRTNPPQKHTVFLSVGLAGDGNRFETSVYPNPSQYLSVFAKNRNHTRAEELFVHGAMHAYNRFHPTFATYQENQSPLPAGDFEEMEATWTELTFRSSKEALVTRVDDLYRTYSSVMNDEFNETILFPLNDKKVFESIKSKSVVIPQEATHGEVEFGHYVLAPLVMLTIEGMLAEKNAPTLDDLLRELHQTNNNFFELLRQHLESSEVEEILRYINGEEKIPRESIDRGLETLV